MPEHPSRETIPIINLNPLISFTVMSTIIINLYPCSTQDTQQQVTFCISNGRESAKYQGWYPIQTLSRFERKLPRKLPLLIQFTVSCKFEKKNKLLK